MSTKPLPPKPPNPVPEEDLNLHEDFAPVIAENGLIRQPQLPTLDEATTSLPAFLTQTDTLQDLVQLRRLEQAEQEKQQEKSHSPEREDARKADKGEIVKEATTTSLTVRTAQTTALVPVSKLTLARRLKLLKRKRQHARRLKARQKQRLKIAAQQERIRQAAGQVPPKNTDASPINARRYRRWPWVLVVLLLLFLGGISGLVPVEKIPGLRNLAYAMGFTKDDTARMSFLRALLTWTDKTIGLPGNWSGEGGNAALLARVDGAAGTIGGAEDTGYALPGLNALSRAGGQTSLIDMQALNALQRQKGYALDGVRGAVKLTPGQEEADLGPAVVRDDKVNVRTEANRDKGEVFFGSDTTAVNRNFKDGYDSTKTLAKVKNPHIADGKPIDWLMNTTQQLMRTNGPLGGINRQLSGTRVSWGDNIAGLGEQKPHRDLYNAWISSRMGDRTSNIMLKKSLADVGFLGADLPTMASTALGGGVQIDTTSFQEDQEAWKEYLEFERKCKEAFNTAGGRITDQIKKFNELVNKGDSWDFPPNCAEAYPQRISYANSKFSQNIGQIESYCNTINADYEVLENQCYLQVSRPTNVCDKAIQTTYQTHWTNFGNICEEKFNTDFGTWFNTWWEQNKSKYQNLITQLGSEEVAKEQVWNSQRESLKKEYQNGAWKTDGAKYTEKNYIDNNIGQSNFNNQTNYSFGGSVTMRNVVLDQQGSPGNYFPKEGDVTQTIIDQMTENKTL